MLSPWHQAFFKTRPPSQTLTGKQHFLITSTWIRSNSEWVKIKWGRVKHSGNMTTHRCFSFLTQIMRDVDVMTALCEENIREMRRCHEGRLLSAAHLFFMITLVLETQQNGTKLLFLLRDLKFLMFSASSFQLQMFLHRFKSPVSVRLEDGKLHVSQFNFSYIFTSF